MRLDPEGACPALHRPAPSPFRPKPGEQFAEQPIVVPGPKMRTTDAGLAPDTQRSGLTKAPGSGGWWWDRALSNLNRSLFAK